VKLNRKATQSSRKDSSKDLSPSGRKKSSVLPPATEHNSSNFRPTQRESGDFARIDSNSSLFQTVNGDDPQQFNFGQKVKEKEQANKEPDSHADPHDQDEFGIKKPTAEDEANHDQYGWLQTPIVDHSKWKEDY